MKKLIAVAALGLASFGFVSPASAFHFTPPNTAFTAHGAFQVTAPGASLACQAHLSGTTTGGAHITGATFSGARGCAGLTASGFPWRMTTVSPHNFGMHGVTISGATIGTCTGNMVSSLSEVGVISVTGASLGPCSVNTAERTVPAISIAGK